MYPHRIRLRGPWECEPLARAGGDSTPLPAPLRMTMPCRWGEGGLSGFKGRVRFRRRFGYPGRIDAHERVWLTFTSVEGAAEVSLNGVLLGKHDANRSTFEHELTPLLRERNELIVDVEGGDSGGLTGETALEVRCSAFLRDLVIEARGSALHVLGEVVGSADGLLELYVVLDRSTVAYETTTASPEGHPFHLVAPGAIKKSLQNVGPASNPVPIRTALEPCPTGLETTSKWADAKVGQPVIVKVDLVNGASVWYTFLRELTPAL